MTAFVMKLAGVPAGTYKGRFAGAEAYEENVEQYGPGYMLRFAIAEGEHVGSESTRICSAKLSPKSTLGKFAVSLKGSAIEPGEAFDFKDYIGTLGMLVVEATPSGSTRVSAFFRS